jgi:hypothetical protein
MRTPLARAIVALVLVAPFAPAEVRFKQSADTVEVYAFLEITLELSEPPSGNPFVDASLAGEFAPAGAPPLKVDGFCDAADGRVFRIRFMPSRPGDHVFSVTYRAGGEERKHTGAFAVRQGQRKGLVRIDPEHPWHFVWEGTGEHFFYNGTTTYWLLGWSDEAVIRESIDRLAGLKVNRIRAALSGRTRDAMRWKEPDVKPSKAFQFRLEPWPAARPEDIKNPGYDVTRFNLAHFQKCERMLRHARERGMVVSLIFHLDGRDPGVDPFGKERMGGPDEMRYYRYAIARFAAFANVMWDVTNEYRLFRDEAWAEKMGAFVKECDPYDHLTSIHGHSTFTFRRSPWADFAMYQSWDEHGGYEFMLKNREEQAKSGRPIPQVNEEYGYEDHYPYPWGERRKAPARVADNRRRLAWEMAMAGSYQTTGERANVPGFGGWITGRGNDAMVMLKGYALLREFFERIPWWKLEPHPELASGGAFCLSEPGACYVLYLARGGSAAASLSVGKYEAKQFNPRSGELTSLPEAAGPVQWKSPVMPEGEDWAFVLSSKRP